MTWGWRPRDRPLSPERICSANSVQDGDRSLCAPVPAKEGDFLASIDEGHVFPGTRSSVVEKSY